MTHLFFKTTLKEETLAQIEWSVENFSIFSRSGTFIKSKSFTLNGYPDCKWYATIKLVESGTFQYLAVIIQNGNFEHAEERNIRVRCVQRAGSEFGYSTEFTKQRLDVCSQTEKCYLAISLGSIDNKLINDTLNLRITLTKVNENTDVKHQIITQVSSN